MRILLTAGYDRADAVLATGELLRREGHEIVGVLVVSAYNLKRVRTLIRRSGKLALLNAFKRVYGLGKSAGSNSKIISEFNARHRLEFSSLKKWCRSAGIPRYSVPNLNSATALSLLNQSGADIVIYGGGGILRQPFIDSAEGRVINSHSGRLPDVRGMNAYEWSLLLDVPTEVTIHLIDRGIDTGPVLRVVPVKPEPGDDISRMRDRCLVAGIEGIFEAVRSFDQTEPIVFPNSADHRQCFTLAPALAEVAELRLAASIEALTVDHSQ